MQGGRTVNRFVLGVVFGACAYAIAWAAGAPVWLAAVIGVAVAALVWFGEAAIDAIADLIDDLF